MDVGLEDSAQHHEEDEDEEEAASSAEGSKVWKRDPGAVEAQSTDTGGFDHIHIQLTVITSDRL